MEDRHLLHGHLSCLSNSGAIDPDIRDAVVSAPAAEILSHGGIHYTTGTSLDVALTIPQCTVVSDIVLDGFSLVQAERENDIDGSRNLYDLLNDATLPDGRHRVTYRLYFAANFGDGASRSVRFLVQQSLPVLRFPALAPAAEFQFTMVPVKEIGGDPVISLSEAELRNTVILAIHSAFGDEGRIDHQIQLCRRLGLDTFDVPGTDVTIDCADVQTPFRIGLYDPSYEIRLQVDDGGIRFGFDVKYDLPDFDAISPCDPTLHVGGSFNLAKDAQGEIVINWTSGPSIDVDVPTVCAPFDFLSFQLERLLSGVITEIAQNRLQRRIQTEFTQAVNEIECPTPTDPDARCKDFIADGDFELRANEVRVPLDLFSLPSVTIEIGYGISRIAQPLQGVPLNGGDRLIITASGLSDVCVENNAFPPGCRTVPVGPAGLLNFKHIPEQLSPLFVEAGGAIKSFNERIEANKALEKLDRYYPCLGIKRFATLPLDSENVGALTTRLAYSTSDLGPRELVGLGTIVNVADDRRGWLSFGNNDIGLPADISSCRDNFLTGPTYGAGLYRITLTWFVVGNPGPATASTIADAHLFYNNSAFDRNGAAVTQADFAAIAPDKDPLFAGGTSSFANISGYQFGINGIFVDVSNLPNDGSGIEASDFTFLFGNDNLPETWSIAPAPAAIGVFANQGVGGADRIFITFADGAVTDTWLGISIRANADTGLVGDETFFFGALPGETGNGFAPSVLGVDAADLQSIARDLTALTAAGTEPLMEPNDLNRDGTVNAFDLQVVAVNLGLNVIRLIAPQMAAAGETAAAVGLIVDASVADNGDQIVLHATDNGTQAAPVANRRAGGEFEVRRLRDMLELAF